MNHPRASELFAPRLLAPLVLLFVIGLVAWAVVALRRAPDAAPAVADADPPSHVPNLPRIPFSNITESSGVEFVHRSGAEGEKLLPESGGGGTALFDYDGDGDSDLLLINGRFWPWSDQAADQPADTLVLYRNDAGQFTDVTAEAGLQAAYVGQGVAVGDYDGDGDDDIFVTALGGNHLYRNEAGRFNEVTGEAGVRGSEHDWTTSTGFFDYDHDGDLDLFVCNYVRWTPEEDRAATRRVSNKVHSYAHPANFEGTHNYLYRNDGGHFTDVSRDAGIQVSDPRTGEPLSKALAVTFADFDRDGWLDIFVANDTVPHFLFHNQRDGTFEEIGRERGFSVNAAGATTSGMGIDAAWFKNDPTLGIAVGNFSHEMSELFVVDTSGTNLFADRAITSGIGRATEKPLTFGLLFDDFDLDGHVDLLHANGHLEPDISQDDPRQSHAQPAQLFWNTGKDDPARMVELPEDHLGDLSQPIVGRGVASGDLDGDGDLDLVITQVDGPPLVARNEQSTGGHWLRLKLEGPPGNPHGIGARVALQTGEITQRRRLMPTRGYLSQSEPVITFGLGDRARVDGVEITWPDGTEQELAPEQVDKLMVVAHPATAESFAALANRGKAELENSAYEEAARLLEAALAERPDSTVVRRNLARAYVLSSRGDEATIQLEQLQSQATTPSAANAYLQGLAALRLPDAEQAVEHFTRAVEIDPNEAALHFQLALALTSLGRTGEAVPHFERAVELDPLHGGAQYQLAVIARSAGEQEEFVKYMRDYQRIRGMKDVADPAALEACTYTRPEAIAVEPVAEDAQEVVPAQFTRQRFARVGEDTPLRLLGVAVHSLGEAGNYHLVGVQADGRLIAFELNDQGRPTLLAQSEFTLAEAGRHVEVLVAHAVDDQTLGLSAAGERGDWPEIAVIARQRSWLIHYRPGDGFTDLSEKSGLSSASGMVGRWIDFDHDGDVDLCTLTDGIPHIWRNNSDGTLVDATAEFGIEVDGQYTDLAAVDLDATNLGTDLALAGPDGGNLFRNQFAGELALQESPTTRWPEANRLLADDFNNDGRPDLLFIADGQATLLTTGGQERLEVTLSLEDVTAATTIDVDNDGALDLAIFGTVDDEPRGYLVRNRGQQMATEPEPLSADGLPVVAGVLDLDADNDGDTDLLLIGSNGDTTLLQNNTPSDHRQLKLVLRSFVGHPSSSGVRVQVRREDHLVSRWTQRELPLEIGMGQHGTADYIQSLWPNGVAKNEVGVELTGLPTRITILEFVRTSSCPFLYAWADERWEFITDLMGTAPLNVSVARGVPMPPDPDEVVVLGSDERFAQGDSAARLRITSELREATYVNHAELLAVDHPRGTDVYSLDRAALTASQGPQVAVGRSPVELRNAVGSDGTNRTAALLAADGRFAPPGRLLPPPVVGFTEPLSVEFDFGPLDAAKDHLLVLSGWFRFGSSSTNIAASQRGDLQVIWPRLEAQDADGHWQVIEEHVGFPAGNTKTIVCDLAGKLPMGTQKLRLTTSFEVRWDHVTLLETVSPSEYRVTAISPSKAEAGWHGFAELRAPAIDQPHLPNLDHRSDVPPWRTVLPGWCTRYGDVTPLVTRIDDALVILNSGDALTLEFPVTDLPEQRAGTRRTLALYTRGWIKEEDPNSLSDRRVGPLPDQDLPTGGVVGDWQLQYNTRWVPRERFFRDAE